MKRPREIYVGQQSFFPVRLLGGFICVDFHFGCNGCSFCLNRRDPAQRKILDAGIQFDIASAGITPRDVHSLLTRSRAFTSARVPIRIGHITDWQYEIDSAHDFLSLIPDDYPVVLMTRFALSNRQISTLKTTRGAVAHITLTPEAPGLECSPTAQIIDTARDLPSSKVLYMLRPLAEGSLEHAKAILRELPCRSHVGFHKLSTDSIPTIGDAKPLAEDKIQELRIFAREQGHHLLDYFGCLFRRNLGIPFFRFGSASLLPDSSCLACENNPVCHAALDRNDLIAVKSAAGDIGIAVDQLVRDNHAINLITQTITGRADEIYISEKSCVEVVISSISRANEPVLKGLSTEVMSRWQAVNLIDVETLNAWGNRIAKLLGN